ncbi:MAG: magnesium transporter MgtE N-terminal domain-containing protein [Gemmatimonadota bacterium]
MRLMIVGTVAFAAGLGGATAIAVKQSHRAAPDSAARVTAVADSAREEAVQPQDSTAGVARDTSTRTSVKPRPTVPAKPAVAQPPVAAAPRPGQPRFRVLSQILVNLKPAEAARILSHLSDDEVAGILESLGPRPAATLLAALPSERAAAMSRRLLAARPDSGVRTAP